MNIEEIRAEKEKMDERIYEQVYLAIDEFYEKTWLFPSYI